MHKKALLRIQQKVQSNQYYITDHAIDEARKDKFSGRDILQGILSGEIVQRQKDWLKGAWKYRIHGKSTQAGRKIGVVVKERNDVVIITVFQEF